MHSLLHPHCIIVIHLGARPQSVTVAKPYQTVRADESFCFTGHITGDSAHNLSVKLSSCMCSHSGCHGWRNDSLAYVIPGEGLATYTLSSLTNLAVQCLKSSKLAVCCSFGLTPRSSIISLFIGWNWPEWEFNLRFS